MGRAEEEERARREREVIESYRVVCLCRKIRRGAIQRAIDQGACSLGEIRARTRAGTGPCGAKRCGPTLRAMLRASRNGR